MIATLTWNEMRHTDGCDHEASSTLRRPMVCDENTAAKLGLAYAIAVGQERAIVAADRAKLEAEWLRLGEILGKHDGAN